VWWAGKELTMGLFRFSYIIRVNIFVVDRFSFLFVDIIKIQNSEQKIEQMRLKKGVFEPKNRR
jgi:hypothetical protein